MTFVQFCITFTGGFICHWGMVKLDKYMNQIPKDNGG